MGWRQGDAQISLILLGLLRELPTHSRLPGQHTDGFPMKVLQTQLGSNYRSEL